MFVSRFAFFNCYNFTCNFQTRHSQEDLAHLVARVSIRSFMIDIASYRSQTDISRGCQKIPVVAIFLIEVECQEIWMFLKWWWRFQFSSEIDLVGTQMKGIDETNRMTLFSILSVMKIRKFSAKNRENYVKKILIPTENTLKYLTRKFKV